MQHLTPSEVAGKLRLQTYEVIQLCRSGRLAATKPTTAGPWLITEDALAAFWESEWSNPRGNPFDPGTPA